MAYSGLAAAIVSSRKAFEDIYLCGIPVLLRENATAFLSLVCSLAAIDALSGWRHPVQMCDRDRYVEVIKEYFSAAYIPHAESLYVLRCRTLHNLSPAHFTVVHAQPYNHLVKEVKEPQDHILSTDQFFADLRVASAGFFADLEVDPEMQKTMLARLDDTRRGGGIFMT